MKNIQIYLLREPNLTQTTVGVCEPRTASKQMESHQIDSHHMEESYSRNICTGEHCKAFFYY